MLASRARNKVLVCGRRWGKTLLGSICVIDGHGPTPGYFKGAVQGAKIGWIAPNYPMSNNIWSILKGSLYGAWSYKSEDERTIRLPTGGSITVKSADNPDSMRGEWYDGLVLDEAALMTKDTWGQVLRPTLSDTQGWAMFISTPRWEAKRGEGVNWFRELYEKATPPEWECWQRPTNDNPTIPLSEIDQARKDIGSLAFEQEYMAHFVSPSGIFKQEMFHYYRRDKEWLLLDLPTGSQEKERRFVLNQCTVFQTVDLAASDKDTADYTVVATWALTPKGEVCLLDVIRGRFEGGSNQELIKQAFNKWRPTNIWIEKVGYQLALIQMLRRPPYSLPIRELVADRNKVSRALLAVAKYEAGLVYHPYQASWLDDWEHELLSFPHGHDDQVDALSYAVSQAIANTPRAYFL